MTDQQVSLLDEPDQPPAVRALDPVESETAFSCGVPDTKEETT